MVMSNHSATGLKAFTGVDKRAHFVTLGTYELAKLFKVNPQTIRRWRRQGRLPCTHDPVEDFLTILRLYLVREHDFINGKPG